MLRPTMLRSAAARCLSSVSRAATARASFVAMAKPATAALMYTVNGSAVTARMSPTALSGCRYYSGAAPLTHDKIQERVLDVLRDFDKVNVDRLSVDAEFYGDLGLDSLDIIEVVMAIEEEFSIDLPDKVAEEIKTVPQAIEAIANAEGAI
ncbi:mitochondrial acyl carrier protein [Dimargaris verticillata]|uniref:Acyl carrier protein n=1 Tax=Dimargaris verticillata TaxID=2761393 RepID=A0A9W8B038_9FUNG|nr:mitochondrial acyl carrier protein [Dimargaris verticillata]